MIATGARARSLPGLEPDGKLVWSYKEAMVPEELPGSLLVVGSGAFGMEFASFYRDLGTEVTVVEVEDRILPVEDAEISAQARKQIERRGIQIMTSASVSALERGEDNVVAQIERADEDPVSLTVDRVILAVGITGNVEDLGLETTQAQIDRGHIVTNEWCETAEAGVYAVGDVSGAPWLAHKATHEGCLLYTSPSPRDATLSRMPSSA